MLNEVEKSGKNIMHAGVKGDVKQQDTKELFKRSTFKTWNTM